MRVSSRTRSRHPVSGADRHSAAGAGHALRRRGGLRLSREGPNGAIFAGTTTGDVVRFEPDGTPSTPESGHHAIRGVAYDPDGKRLFFAESGGAGLPDGGGQAALHIARID